MNSLDGFPELPLKRECLIPAATLKGQLILGVYHSHNSRAKTGCGVGASGYHLLTSPNLLEE
jgi:hypothetical protein